jgi:hypothetical protein
MRRLSANPAIRSRASATKRGRAFSDSRGGNGLLTARQQSLRSALGWQAAYPVPTGQRAWSRANLDLAEPLSKTAVEVDGASHHTAKQRNRDARKETTPVALGWTVLRFWSSETDQDLTRVVATVRAVVRARSSASTG